MQFSVKLGYIVGEDDNTIQKQSTMAYVKQKNWLVQHTQSLPCNFPLVTLNWAM
jgi:hypothetical protein